MNCLQLLYLLGLGSCFCWAKDVQFEASRTIYNVGDTVTLTCNVRSGWLTVAFGRNNSDLGYCFTKMNRCFSTADKRDRYSNYELKLEKSRPMLVIKNVTIDEDGADFTCHWTSYTDTTSFAVTDEQVQFEATKTIYNVGDTVTLKCYVRSGWLTVKFRRNNSDLGYCFTKMNRCFSTADKRDRYSNYELKLEKSRPMLVIKNVTIDEDGADFTCHWTSYTDTTSIAVTDKAVTTPSTPEENRSDISTVLVSVLVPVVVVVIVLVIVAIVIVRKHVLYRCIDEVGINWFGRRPHEHVQAPINTYAGHTCVTGQELLTFSDNIGENIYSLSPNGDVSCDHQTQRDRHMEDIHGPSVHGTECVTPFLEKNDR